MKRRMVIYTHFQGAGRVCSALARGRSATGGFRFVAHLFHLKNTLEHALRRVWRTVTHTSVFWYSISSVAYIVYSVISAGLRVLRLCTHASRYRTKKILIGFIHFLFVVYFPVCDVLLWCRNRGFGLHCTWDRSLSLYGLFV